MATYGKCPKYVSELMQTILDTHHPKLAVANVNVSCLFAYAPRDEMENPKGPAIKLHGYPCAATIKITSLQRRVLGAADAEMTIDGDEWPHWSEKRRMALLDHELLHLSVVESAPGLAKTDDARRPCLKARLHDLVAGGFSVIVGRYGDFSFDHQQISDMMDKHGQLLFPWLNFAKPRSGVLSGKNGGLQIASA